jgi:hypothetical protein
LSLYLLACSGSEILFFWNLWIYWIVDRTPWTGNRPDATTIYYYYYYYYYFYFYCHCCLCGLPIWTPVAVSKSCCSPWVFLSLRLWGSYFHEAFGHLSSSFYPTRFFSPFLHAVISWTI